MNTALFSQLIGYLRLDLRCRAEHIFTRVDLLTATGASEDLRSSVAHSSRTEIQEVTIISLQRVADISQHCAFWQNDLPIGAYSREESFIEFRPGECTAGQRDDSSSLLRNTPDIESFSHTHLQT